MVFIVTGIIIAAIAVLILSGPRVKLDTRIHPIHLPDDLDAYVKDRESRIPGIRPGLKKGIVWARKKGEKTENAIVYLHGYSASRKEISPVIERIGENLKANIFFTRFAGHGIDAEAMKDATINDWVNDVWEAYEIAKRIGEKIILAGFSTGAPLAMWLAGKISSDANAAGKKPPDIKALILMSANFAPADPAARIILWPWGNLFIRLIMGKYHQFTPINELHEKYWTVKHRSESLMPMMAASRLGLLADHPGIDIPSLFIYTENDKVVSIPALKKVFDRLGCSRKKIISINEATDHILTGDAVSPRTTGAVTGHVVEFLRELE